MTLLDSLHRTRTTVTRVNLKKSSENVNLIKIYVYLVCTYLHRRGYEIVQVKYTAYYRYYKDNDRVFHMNIYIILWEQLVFQEMNIFKVPTNI